MKADLSGVTARLHLLICSPAVDKSLCYRSRMLVLEFIFWLFMLFSVGSDFRYRARRNLSTNWPTARATIQKGEAQISGPYLSLTAAKVPKGLFGYSYSVKDHRYVGFFTVACALGLGEAEDLQEQLNGQSLTIRYNPNRPQESFVVEREILGKRVHQGPNWVPRSLRRLGTS